MKQSIIEDIGLMQLCEIAVIIGKAAKLIVVIGPHGCLNVLFCILFGLAQSNENKIKKPYVGNQQTPLTASTCRFQPDDVYS